MLLAETDNDGNLIASYTRADTLISQTREGATSTYLYDGHGDVRALLNEAGRITDKYSYTAYGDLIEQNGDIENHFRYTGEYYDGVSDLYYLRARYMSTETGTFISMDTYEGSIYDPDSLHKYLYANGNPVKYNDPSGNFFSAVESIEAFTINTIADNYRTLQVMGLISGFAKATIAAASGCSPEEITREFIDGYCIGFGVGALMYIAAACTVLSIAQIFMFDAGFKSVMYLVLSIVAVTTKHPKQALEYYTLSILCIFTFAKLYNIECEVNIIGDKGSMQVGCNYSNPEGGNATVWTGKDKYVPELANAIEQKFPGKIKAVERIIEGVDGKIITDLDIELENIVIQVKSGSAKGLTSQMIRTAEATGKTVISYTPDISQSSAVLRGVRQKGFETFTTLEELLEYLSEHLL